MRYWLSIARAIDRLNGGVGRAVAWLTLVMVLLGAFNAVVRYLGRWAGWSLSSNAYIELQWYLFGVVFLLGAAYTLSEGAHVRVDVFYGRLSPRGQAWVSLLGTLLFLIPFAVFALVVSWPFVANSWSVREVSPDPGGLPRYPIKAVIPVAFAMLLLQAVSEAVRAIAVLRGLDTEAEDDGEPDRPAVQEWTV